MGVEFVGIGEMPSEPGNLEERKMTIKKGRDFTSGPYAKISLILHPFYNGKKGGFAKPPEFLYSHRHR